MRLLGLPPIEHIRVDALVDDPLLARMVKTEVTGLGPRREMPDLIVRTFEFVEAIFVQQVALVRTHRRHLVPTADQRGNQIAAEKAGRSSDENSH